MFGDFGNCWKHFGPIKIRTTIFYLDRIYEKHQKISKFILTIQINKKKTYSLWLLESILLQCQEFPFFCNIYLFQKAKKNISWWHTVYVVMFLYDLESLMRRRFADVLHRPSHISGTQSQTDLVLMGPRLLYSVFFIVVAASILFCLINRVGYFTHILAWWLK